MSSENNHLSLPSEAARPSLWQPQPIDKVTIDQVLRGLKRRSAVGILAGALVSIGFLGYSYLFLRSYRHSVLVQVEPIQSSGARPGTSLESLRQLAPISLPLLSAETKGDVATLVQVLNSDIVLRPIYEKFLVANPDLDPKQYSYQSFIGSLKIQPAKLTSGNRLLDQSSQKIIEIQFSAREKEKIESLLGILVEELKRFSEKEKQDQIADNLRYVNQEIQKTLSQIDDLEDQLNQFRFQNRVVRPDLVASQFNSAASGSSDLETYLSLLDNLISARNENRVKLESAQATFNSLEAQLRLSPTEALAAANLAASQSYQELLLKLTETETKLAGEQAKVNENSPTVQALQEEKRLLLEQARQQARQITIRNQDQVRQPETLIGYQSAVSESLIEKYIETRIELEALRRADAELSNQIQATEAEISRVIRLANPYRKIEQRFAAAQESLRLLLQTRQSLQLQIAQRDFTWRVLSDIDNKEEYQVTQRLLRALVIALMLGGVSGLFLALVLDWLDDRFLEVEQIRQQTPLPILGEIPLTKTFDQLAFSRLETPLTLWGLQHRLPSATPAFRESFYFLLTQLESLGLPRSLAITGTAGKEGQTTLAIYLAVAAAAMGKRVLLVDANLRQPSMHQGLGIPNVAGLGELLQGEMPFPHWFSLLANRAERLWVLTAGQVQQEPMILLSSARWFDFLEGAKDTFDCVILDVPPILAAAEAHRVLAAVERALLVVRLKKTRREAFAQALQACDLSLQQKLLGIVVNGVAVNHRDFRGYQNSAAESAVAPLAV
ncbi:AAA family ATPase [Thermosynechococcus sp. PP22]|uniref:GumC family protein n=1 Tax=Thermosynechococcus sp. PP22 TaxID=3074082 RepID=UPI002873C2D4|nr:AAA family ATPase [Thermosynechococcus sp. PP22]WNC23023.1 AAA family ATPase [Thermosynechococcus sp. PP22]